ncbi:ATP-binding protein [Vibrio proteolyticus]|uniref:histidine kinase n=1 Tax=Vibrio proteolyticus NBRC 13287 TaxID=1219065 RepID=U3A195_VIBPR|nr:ATP-binding protein [Vibrio proteolyticus]GAD67460.1 putative two-component histidine kinase [Vibrio proteolyticus NBRC 13287]
MPDKASYIKRLSLKSRLLLAAALWLSAMILAAGIGIPLLVKDYLVSDAKSQLHLSMDEIAANIETDRNNRLDLSARLSDPRFSQPYSGLYWTIQSDKQTLRSRSLWDKNITAEKRGPVLVIKGAREEPLITITQTLYLPEFSEPIRVMVGVDEAPIGSAVKRITGQLWIILGMLFTGVLILIGVQVSWSLRPLTKMQKELAELKDGNKDALSYNYPREVSPLVSDLNALLFHYQDLLARARNHAGNLSHALKTPLSVLRNEIGIMQSDEKSRLLAPVEQIQNQIDYHLGRARMAGSMNILSVKTKPAERVDFISLAFDKVYAHRGIVVVNELDSDLEVAVDSADLDEMIGNVLENSYKWANSLVRVHAEPSADKGDVRLCLEDDGPGIAECDLHKAIERGVRLDEKTPGTGLGLNIVSEMAHSYRGKLELERSSMGGLKTVLTIKKAH